MPHSFPTRRPSDRAKAARQKAQSARREQRRSRSPVLPPAARHGGQRRGRREQQDRRMKRLWQRQPGAERGCEQQAQRQPAAMDQEGEGQAETHHVEQPHGGGGEAQRNESLAGGGVCPENEARKSVVEGRNVPNRDDIG